MRNIVATATPSPTKVITGRVRLSYVQLFQAKQFNENQKAKYSCVILVPKDDTATINKIKAAQKAALKDGESKVFGGKIPSGWKNTFRDADSPEEADTLEANPEYANHYFMSVSNPQKPGIIDRDKEPITDPQDLYSGCYARVSLNAYAFNQQGNKGVSFGLNNVQKLADGEPLGNISRAEDDFADEFDAGDDIL